MKNIQLIGLSILFTVASCSAPFSLQVTKNDTGTPADAPNTSSVDQSNPTVDGGSNPNANSPTGDGSGANPSAPGSSGNPSKNPTTGGSNSPSSNPTSGGGNPSANNPNGNSPTGDGSSPKVNNPFPPGSDGNPSATPPSNPQVVAPPYTNYPGGNPGNPGSPGTPVNPPGGPTGNLPVPPVTVTPPYTNYPGNGNNPLPPPPAPAPTTPIVLNSLKPVLAVKAMDCVACHATITSNVVTDFGLGTPNFFKQAYGAWDQNYRLGWPTAAIQGKIIVPSQQIAQADLNASDLRYAEPAQGGHAGLDIPANISLPNTLAAILQTPWRTNSDRNISSIASQFLLPSGAQDPNAVMQRSTVVIRTPSVDEIKNLFTKDMKGLYPKFEQVGLLANQTSDLYGLSIAAGDTLLSAAGTKIVRNSAGVAVTCHGDIAIDGTLYLKDLNLITDADGCRLYVTETVFIEGPISSNRPYGEHNLQITSARAIMMGMGLTRMGVTSVAQAQLGQGALRLPTVVNSLNWNPWTHLGTGYDANYEPGIDPATRGNYFDSIATDARKVGRELKEATDVASYPNPLPAGYNKVMRTDPTTGQVQSRIDIQYSGLLLNAPHVHSGYLGQFKGVIIANVLNFVISHFNFVYDPMFDNVSEVLPMIKPVLQISDQ